MLRIRKQFFKKKFNIEKRFKSKKNLEIYENKYKIEQEKIEKKKPENLELKYQKILNKELKNKNKW